MFLLGVETGALGERCRPALVPAPTDADGLTHDDAAYAFDGRNSETAVSLRKAVDGPPSEVEVGHPPGNLWDLLGTCGTSWALVEPPANRCEPARDSAVPFLLKCQFD